MRAWLHTLLAVVAPQAAHVQEAHDQEVDWPSRTSVGHDYLYEFELEDRSELPGSGGTVSRDAGTIRDIVFANDDEYLGVRIISSFQNGRRIRFFRTGSGGRVDDAPPVGSFLSKGVPGLPYADPIGASASQLEVGLVRNREIVIRNHYYRVRFGDPVMVRESVTAGTGCEDRLRIVLREWSAEDEQGIPSSSTENTLLLLWDRIVFDPETGRLVQRSLRFETRREGGKGMIDHHSLDLRELEYWQRSAFHRVEEEGRILREAFHAARARPWAALSLLSDWAAIDRGPSRFLDEVAAAIWLMATRYDQGLSKTIERERNRYESSDWATLKISEEEARFAFRAGRSAAVIRHAGLDSAAHRRAYLESLAAAGRGQGEVKVLARLYGEGFWHLKQLERAEFTESQKAEASALLAAQLEEFRE